MITVTLNLPLSTMTVGQTQNPTVEINGVVEGDNTMDAREILWTSSNTAVASVTSSVTGVVVKAVAPGTATIGVSVSGASDTAPVTVAPVTVDITGEQEAQIAALPVGSRFLLQGPTTVFDCQVNG